MPAQTHNSMMLSPLNTAAKETKKNVVGVPPQLIEISLAVNSASGVFLFLGHSFSIWGLANRV